MAIDSNCEQFQTTNKNLLKKKNKKRSKIEMLRHISIFL